VLPCCYAPLAFARLNRNAGMAVMPRFASACDCANIEIFVSSNVYNPGIVFSF
jgi:hypothetical protein